ncbi:hypothetical protein [Microcystis phage Mwe-JY13]
MLPPKPRNEFKFAEMKVGDFKRFTEDATRAQNAASKMGTYRGWKFTARKQPDGSTVIWRIK